MLIIVSKLLNIVTYHYKYFILKITTKILPFNTTKIQDII